MWRVSRSQHAAEECVPRDEGGGVGTPEDAAVLEGDGDEFGEAVADVGIGVVCEGAVVAGIGASVST